MSFGTLGLTGAYAGASRVRVLPSPWWLLAAFAIIALAAIVAGRRRAVLLWLSLIVLLAWLPIPVPAAALMWTGPLRWWVWSAIAVAIVGSAFRRIDAGPAKAVPHISGIFADPRRAPRVAAGLAAGIYLLAAWQISPQLPGGDEPHYLVIAQSLWKDGDLKIENNHLRGDYSEYFRGPLKPDYLARGVNGEIYSVHAPGLPAVIAPVFAVFGYPGVLAFLAFVSGCATALAWRAVWIVTRDIAASWFGWATVSLSVPFLFQAFTVYPDGFGAALVMAGVLTAILGERASPRVLMATGLALAVLPWLHARFAVTAAALGLVIVARQLAAPDRLRRVVAFAAVPVIGALAWFSFFYVIYGSPNPAVVYNGYTQSAVGNIPRSLIGLLFDQQFGLLPKAPTGNAGHLTAGIDRLPAPLWTWDLSAVHGKWSRTLKLANDAHALRVDADAATRCAIGDITIRAERRLAAHERVSDQQAWRASRCRHATLFLLDGGAYVEAGGS